MKCKLDQDGDACRRCRRAGLSCTFVPRANAAAAWKATTTALVSSDGQPGGLGLHLLQRIKAIEDHIGLSVNSDAAQIADGVLDHTDDEGSQDGVVFDPLWQAASSLEKCCIAPHNPGLWRRAILKRLFQSFHQKMPGLHFLPDRQRYSAPRPLLLAAILYCSSARGSPEEAELSPHYFMVLCSAVSQLSIPRSEIGSVPSDPSLTEEWAFQTVLGLVLAGLLAEASVRETGVWISIAYRLILEHYPPFSDERRHDWRKLFNGVQIVDLEHASLHLSSPVIPIEPPIASLQTSHRDQLYRLSRMMHTGLAHFAGRGLPTIWSYLAEDVATSHNAVQASPFTAVDAAVLRDWARQLDDWLDEFTRAPATEGTSEDRRTVFRQYVLHRLVVLSIYHPARGCNLQSHGMTAKEQYELLLSARATVKLHHDDKTIWSNWDIVMITWATLIVIQGMEGGVGEANDIHNIRAHLASLRETNEPSDSLRYTLAARLTRALEGIQTPSPSGLPQNVLDVHAISPDYDQSWQIFNETSLEEVMFSAWPHHTGLQQQNGLLDTTNLEVYPTNQTTTMNPW